MFLATSSDCQGFFLFNRILWGRKENFLQPSSRVLATCERAFVVCCCCGGGVMCGGAAGGEPKSRSCGTAAGSLSPRDLQQLCVQSWLLQCWWCQDLRIFLSWCTDLKGVIMSYISRLLIHALDINTVRCLSWWINNFHNLFLVFSSVPSGIVKSFWSFGIYSWTKPPGVVFSLDAFLPWSVAQYKSLFDLLVQDTWTVPSVARYTPLPNSHWTQIWGLQALQFYTS